MTARDWQGRRAAVFGAPGLGDGLLALSIAENLRRAGAAVRVYHDGVRPLAAWFPDARIAPLPAAQERAEVVAAAHFAFLGHPDLAPERVPAHAWVFRKSACDRRRTYLAAVADVLRREHHLPWYGAGNGLVAPPHLARPRRRARIVLHPASSSPAKAWLPERFAELARRLRAAGHEPCFLAPPAEAATWRARAPEGVAVHAFEELADVAAFLATARAAVCLDSGIGHLASNVGLPVVSIFRRRSSARFWLPCWAPARAVVPPYRLPGKHGSRGWARRLPVRRVQAALADLLAQA